MRQLKRFVAAVFVAVTLPASAQNCGPFTDVPAAASFCSDVLWMFNRGITLGCAPTLYCPNNAVSRAQMALFMRRLANALSPAGIILVAPQGGETTSIQAAIDAATLVANATNPVLVKVAPGVYTEQVTLRDFVHVEGSGPGATVIQFDGIGGTLIAGASSEVRNLKIVNRFNGGVPGAVAVIQSGNTPAGSTLLSHVALLAAGAFDNTALRVEGGTLTFEGRAIDALPSAPGGAAVGVQAIGATAQVRLRRTVVGVGASAGARHSARGDNGGTVLISDTELGADTTGSVDCFNTYTPALAAKTC